GCRDDLLSDFVVLLGYSKAGLSLIPSVHFRLVLAENSLSCLAVPTAEKIVRNDFSRKPRRGECQG
ncbi:hypothetical protein, partial [Marinicella litoralis]|uniref:hypothetical protein n=1 Tax=Marinicella litoralis TaxID=644220 RepID=UPI001C557AD4